MAIFCLLCGGDSLESDISYVSYKKIKQELKYSNIATIDVYLNRFGEFYLIENNKLKKGQFVKHNYFPHFIINIFIISLFFKIFSSYRPHSLIISS